MYQRLLKTILVRCLFCLIASCTVNFASAADPSYTPDQVVSDGTTIYLLSATHKKIYRWSIAGKSYLAPIDVGVIQSGNSVAPTKMALSATQKRLYLGYSTGQVNYISLSGVQLEVPFATLTNPVLSLGVAGKYLVVQGGYDWSSYMMTSVFSSTGALTDSQNLPSSASFEWSAKNSRLYSLNYAYYPYYLTYQVVDQSSGKFTGTVQSYNWVDYGNSRAIRISADEANILTGAGEIQSSKDLAVTNSIGARAVDARWLSNGGLVSISSDGSGKTVVQRRDAALRVVEYLAFSGQPIGVFGKDSKMVVLTLQNGSLVFNAYAPSDDTDGDGVANLLDDFPLDAAASLDSDKDGYPDSWNKGFSASSNGLIIDAFPKDSACYSGSQALKGKCNYAAMVPAFYPDQVLSDGKIIYMLSKYNKRVYRWSIATASYINPFILGLNQGLSTVAPTSIALSTAHKRLYLGYENGNINYIALSGSVAENRFGAIPKSVSSLVSVGNFLLAESYINGWKHIVLDASGLQTFIKTEADSYPTTFWDPVNSRVYFQRAWYSGLYYEVVNQASGKITQQGAAEAYSDYYSGNSLAVSVDGKKVVLGNGSIYGLPNLSLSSTLGISVKSAKWLDNADLVSLTFDSNQTIMQRRDINMSLVEEKPYAGVPVGVYGTPSKMVVVTMKSNVPTFYIYVPNNDTDGDGVANPQDAFPEDPAASVDVDRDGYPDVWNKGRTQVNSTTGLVLDAFPKDTACFLASHGIAGKCDYSATVPNFVPDQTVSDGETVYLLSSANKRIYRWSIKDNSYTNPLVVAFKQGTTLVAPTKIALSTKSKRLYLGYQSGVIRYINLSNSSENPFANTASSLNGLAVVGNYILAQDNSGAWATHYIFDQSGALTDKKDWNYYSREYAWDAQSSRVYFMRDNMSPGDLHYEVIDQVTGKITAAGEAPYHGSYNIAPPIRVSTDGKKVLLGSGDVYSAPALNWSYSLNSDVVDAKWLSDNSLVGVSNINGTAFVQRFGVDNKVLEQQIYEGVPVGIYGSDSKMVVMTIINGRVSAFYYEPNNDTDGDGISNTQDAFPADGAASVDTDRDGYPDAWNTGKSQVDSSTNLQLDAFPNDSACYLTSHGVNGLCNYAATVPSFVPDKVLSDGEIIYLLSAANQRVYRWSIATSSYINPFIIGLKQGNEQIEPTLMTISIAHNRLYLGYETGAIHYISLSGGAEEVSFGFTAGSVRGLASVGNYLLAQDFSGAWASHYIFDIDGVLTDHKDWNDYSREYAWDPQNSRVYYFRDNSSPNDLQYEEINQTTGKITGKGETPYHGSYLIKAPIRVSVDGNTVLLGSGDLYKAPPLTWAGSLGLQIVDAKWLSGGGIVTVTTDDTSTNLERRNASLALDERISFPGKAVGVFGSDAHMVAITLVGNTLSFQSYIPSSDSDGDGVSNTSDAFPLDAAASIDSDRDGYPDSWNAGKSQSDSTTGLKIDAYSNDSACYLLAHGDGVNCDFSATMPTFIPDQVETDGNIIYLLSKENKKIYRWSIATSTYLNPLVVGLDHGFTKLAPTKMTISNAHHRLYLGYSTGAIQFINLQGLPNEAPFANTAMSIGGLAAAGNFILAQDDSGAWYTHYIFDENGVLTDSKDWNYYSSEYTWSEASSKIYFFRDGSSPNDLHFEIVDQASGKITASGETPYHGEYYFKPPIRLSPDENKILTGIGNIFNSSNLSWVATLNYNLVDAFWGSNTIATIEDTGSLKIWDSSNFTLLHTFQYSGTPLRLVAQEDDLILVRLVSGALTYTKVLIGDHDHDGLPKWWEEKFGLSDADAQDALADGDGDALSNLNEYSSRTDPTKFDSDMDGISDGDEINNFHTDPLLKDSDSDGLNDYAELFTHLTNPKSVDSDLDGFRDAEEVLVYLTDPNDVSSLPPALTSLSESFESDVVPPLWVDAEASQAAWYVDSSQSSSGGKSLRSGDITDSQKSGVHMKTVFAAGSLQFEAKLESESCCDRLELYVDGVLKLSTVTSTWASFSVSLSSGIHDLEWRYVKDGSVSRGADAAWIDQISFTTQ